MKLESCQDWSSYGGGGEGTCNFKILKFIGSYCSSWAPEFILGI